MNLSLAIHFNTSVAFLLHLLQILYKGKLIAMIDKIDLCTEDTSNQQLIKHRKKISPQIAIFLGIYSFK